MVRTRADTSGGVGDRCARAALALFVAGSGCTTEEPRATPSQPLPPPVEPPFCELKDDCLDFPSYAITSGAVPRDAESLFARSPEHDLEACLIEPEDGSLLPKNWLPPRFRFEPLAGENLWQIRLSFKVERHDLIVYTTRPQWTMDAGMWGNLKAHAEGKGAISVRVRGVNAERGGPISETNAEFQIAPVEAAGTIVYWAADGPYGAGGETKLVQLQIDQPRTVDVLQVNDVTAEVLNESGAPKPGDDHAKTGRVRCIGCHTSTPDGDAVAFVDHWPWNSVVASIADADLGQRPSYVTETAARLLQQPWQGAPTFSKQYWDEHGERLMVQSFGSPSLGWGGSALTQTGLDRLIWFNLSYEPASELPEVLVDLNLAVAYLEDEAFGFIERRGDPEDGDGDRGAVNPTWSHSGEKIAYVSATATLDGHAGGSPADPTQEVETDIYWVPFGSGLGGDAVAVDGASEKGVVEYYPDYSWDDQFIAFTRAESTEGPVYYRSDGEIFIVPESGAGMATRLAANDPPRCTGQRSPGIINSWPKWSPEQHESEGKQYYWLIFSSARAYRGQFTLERDEYSPEKTDSSQLYVAPVVVEGTTITSYPALYLYNQTTNTTNLTPAWDRFESLVDEIE